MSITNIYKNIIKQFIVVKSKIHIHFQISIFLFVFMFALIGCENKHDNRSSLTNENKQHQFFVFDKQVNIKLAVAELIKTSEIAKGGYVTIITSAVKNNWKKGRELKNIFYKQGVVGVHIITLNNKTTLNKTDILTIENSKIICILEKKNRVFINLANKTNLTTNLKTAKANGCLIAGIGKSYEMFGEFFLFRHIDTTRKINKLIQRKGLDLQSEMIFTNSKFFNSNYDDIQNMYADKNIAFLTIGKGTYVLMNNSQAHVFGRNSMEIISTNNTRKTIKSGELLNIQP